jgi:nucleotide-binding universal stress UspA family protein
MAVITTLSLPPMLRWALKRLPMREDERIRLEREEIDARGFVTNLERLLVAVDGSPNGKFAASLAGVIGGSSGKPTTILEMAAHHPLQNSDGHTKALSANGARANADGAGSAHEARSAAERVTTLEAHPDDEKQGSIEVTTVRKHLIGPEEVAEEARKGYDLLLIGIADTRDPTGGFSQDVSSIAKGFDGPLAVVDSRGSQFDRLFKRNGKILIPVNGTDVSRRAAEVGFTLARANDAQVTVLYVTRAPSTADRRGGRLSDSATRRNDEAVLKDIGALADRYEVTVRRSTRSDIAPDEAIISEASLGYDLIVLGASRRPGETLFLGNTAAAVLDRSDTSKLFVGS